MVMPGWGQAPIYSPWGVDPGTVVTLPGGIELVADDTGHPELTLARWDGWTNGADSRGGAVLWETADGGVEGDVHLSGRNLAFEGLILADSPSRMWELSEQMGSILTRERWGTLRVDEEHLGLSRQVSVARGGRPVVTPLTATVAAYQVQLQSASPLRLDVTEQSVVVPAGGVDLVNAGNHPAAVTLTLRGPLTNPGLAWPGGSWVYRGTVGSGQTISVDMWRRVVRDPATSKHSRNLVVASSTDWLRLAPGTTRVSRTGTGAGSITAAWRSSWS